MGAVDLVIQVESPKSVTRGLQRIGRAGHGVGEVSRGRIFPKFRADLLECAVVARRMREGLIETTVVPRNPLDVLAQQVVAIAASAGEEGVAVDELHALFRRTWTYAELERRQLENVLDMLDGRYPSQEFGDLRPRIVLGPARGHHPGRGPARGRSPWPTRGPSRTAACSASICRTAAGSASSTRRWSTRPAPGRRSCSAPPPGVSSRSRATASSSRRRPGCPAPCRSGTVRASGARSELGAAIGAFAREAVRLDEDDLRRDYDLDERAASNLLAFLREQEAATGVVPSDRTLVAERFRDEIGDWRLCVLSPYGGRVHAAWALALSARIRDAFGLEADAIWSDDGIIVHLPDADEPPGAELVLVEPDEVEDLVVAELGASALFGARFRENASRSLLIPRAYPGRRTPLWQQRLKAQSLLEVARRYPQFPVILETYRECLRDVLDVPGLEDLLRRVHTRDVALVEVETQTASPFASSLLFDYVATYMYEGDTPAAERRAVALALDRDLLRELLGQEELRDLIDPGALERVEDDLQYRSEHLRARDADALHDVLRRVGDLTAAEVAERAEPSAEAGAWLARLGDERRAVSARIGGEERWFAAEDAGLYRDALGVVPPGGLPAAFLEDVPDALLRLVRRFARTHGPFEAGAARARYAVDAGPALAELERAGELVQGELRPLGTRARVVRPGGARAGCAGRRSRCCARRSSPSARRRWPASPPRGRASTGSRRRARASAVSATCWRRSRAWRWRRRCGRGTSCRAASARTRRTGWTSSAPAERWSGSAGARLGGDRGASRCTSVRTRPCSARRPAPVSLRAASSTCACASASRAAPASSPTCWWTSRTPAPASCARRSGTSPGLGRSPTTRSRHCAREGPGQKRRRDARPGAPPPVASAAAPGARRRSRAAGRWPRPCSAPRPATPTRGAGRGPSSCSSVTACSRASSCAPRASPAGSPRCTRRCRRSRRWVPRAAATSSKAWAAPSSRCPAPSSGCARRRRGRRSALVIAAADPAQLYGAGLRWPGAESARRRGAPAPTS